MDDADRADAEIERATKVAVLNAKVMTLPAKGECYNCEAGFGNDPVRRFCDAECRDDWEAGQRRKESARFRSGVPVELAGL
jgi:hypothetical protein